MILALAILFVIVAMLLAGLVERGYLGHVWKWTSRMGRGRVYRDDSQP